MCQKTIQNQCLLRASVLLGIVFCLFSCDNDIPPTPQGYLLHNPQLNYLGDALVEISGIHFTSDSVLLAIADNKEKVVQIDLRTQKLKDLTNDVVEPNSDLEDIVQVDSTVYLLLSKGIIKEIPPGVTDTVGVKTYDMGLPGTNDFETMYYDPTARGLVLMCKSCAHEKGEDIRSAFRFDLQTKSFDNEMFFTISRENVKNILKNSDAKFEPSAAAIHPINKRLYILSSAGNLLVVTDTRGKVIEAYDLNPDDFPQAEGIAFAPNGDMYISNEGKYGKPTLLLFPYARTGKKK